MAEHDCVVIGAGAAGLAAARALRDEGLDVMVLEARGRIGGRAHTRALGPAGDPQDLGCGWLHSGDVNPFVGLADGLGFEVDRTPPRWGAQSRAIGFPLAEQASYRAAIDAFFERMEAAADGPDRSGATCLEPGCRWNPLIDAVSTYINGVELDRVSVHDFHNYADTEVNWRVTRGYGALIEAYGRDLPVTLDCPVEAVDHSGRRVRVRTSRGTLGAAAVVVCVPSTLLAAGTPAFHPALPDKRAAAADLPLGVADKCFFALDGGDDLPRDGHVYARFDTARIGTYHVRPFGRAMIEGFFGGALARDLEAGGPAAFEAFGREELGHLFGAGFGRRLTFLASTAWARDPLSLGSYSYAPPGRTGARAVLAAPVDDRLFFAGEATSIHDFSTAHGAYRSGLAAGRAAARALRARAA